MSGEPPPHPLDERDDALVRAVDGEMERAVAAAGPLFACGPGRTDCCLGPFPVNLLDARRLERGLRALASTDPARAEGVRRRAGEAVERLARSFPGDVDSGLLSADEAAEERFAAEHAAEPCPALDPATGRCDVYAWRPLACRTLGPPARLGETDLDPCPFCFGPASPEDLERCRARPDAQALEDPLVAEVERRLGRKGDTIVAFALAAVR